MLLRERVSAISTTFFLITLTVSGWLASIAAMYAATDASHALFWAKICYVAVPLIPATIYHFSWSLLESDRRQHRLVVVIWLIALAFMCACVSGGSILRGVQHHPWGFYPRLGGVGAALFLLFFGIALTASLRLHIVDRGRPRPLRQHQRARAFLIAFSFGYLGSVDFLPSLGVEMYPFGFLAVATFLVLAARAIIRYRLADLTSELAAAQVRDAIPAAIFVVDTADRVQVANRFAAQLVGRSEEEMSDAEVGSVTRAQPDDANSSLQWRDSSGRAIDVVVSEASIVDESGRTAGRVIVGVDVTAQRRLEKIAEERQAELGRQEEASRAKDELLALVAHDLRSPIASILGWVRYAEENRSDAALVDDALRSIHESARMQARVVDDLFDVARIAAGALEIHRFRFDARASVRAVTEGFLPIAADRGIELVTALPDAPVIVHADDERLQQVIWNLVANAMKFTGRGGTITVSLRTEEASAVIQVTDTGVGIDAALLPHVFERYRKGSSTQSGLGLGLNIVLHLVEMHGGSVSAASDGAGQGATFTIRLPLLSGAPA